MSKIPSSRALYSFLFASRFKYILLPVLLFSILYVFNNNNNHHHSSHSSLESAKKLINPNFDHFAIALKSGKDVVLERAPIQLLTFLHQLKNVIMIGESPGLAIGDIPMIDVCTNLYQTSEVFKRTNEQVRPAENGAGWKDDAHKNLPGFKELYNRFPDAEWYVMIDDDTYLLMDNLNKMLSRYDYRSNHYFGSGRSFVGCDGIHEWHKSPLFAHGGSGIVLSRGALLKMLTIIDTCILNYRDCWAGDIRTSLCLRDTGIHLKSMFEFNSVPPNDNLYYFDPCFKPVSFHHLMPAQTQKVYEFERSMAINGTTSINLADLAHHFLKDGYMMDTDREGGDYEHFGEKSLENCLHACQNDRRCVSFTHFGNLCWLKNAIPTIGKKKNAVSGLVLKHFKCLH